MYNRWRMTRFPSQLSVMQLSVWSSYVEQQLAFVSMALLGQLLVHIILNLIHWWVDIFLSQKAKVQLRPLRIPIEHDERGNRANGKDKTTLDSYLSDSLFYRSIFQDYEQRRRSVVAFLSVPYRRSG